MATSLTPSAWDGYPAPAPRSRREARQRRLDQAAPAAVPRCGCGAPWPPARDRCGFCGELRRSTLPGVLRLTGRHWLAGRRRDPGPAQR